MQDCIILWGKDEMSSLSFKFGCTFLATSGAVNIGFNKYVLYYKRGVTVPLYRVA